MEMDNTMEEIIIRGLMQCPNCGEYILSKDYDYDRHMCFSCVYEEEEDDELRYERQESARIEEIIF
jgi:ribosomal protein L32